MMLYIKHYSNKYILAIDLEIMHAIRILIILILEKCAYTSHVTFAIVVFEHNDRTQYDE